ncbi:MAG: hypothetical protein AAF907_08960, partial [Planctomycetota bacterium]
MPDAAAPPGVGCGLRLRAESRTPIKDLPGFRPNHRVPQEITSQTQFYVSNLGEPGVAADLERIAKLLR